MKKRKSQVLVAGLGRFGQSVALTLIDSGVEVLGIDNHEERVAEVAQKLTHSAVADTTEMRVIEALGIPDFDSVVCAIGTDLEASLMTTMLLKECGARFLTAKATTEMHGKLLTKIGADRVIFPEREVGARVGRDLAATNEFVEVVPLSLQESMFELQAPNDFCGRTIKELDLRRTLGLNVIALRRAEDTVVSPGPDEVVRRGDLMFVVGNKERAKEALEEPDEDS